MSAGGLFAPKQTGQVINRSVGLGWVGLGWVGLGGRIPEVPTREVYQSVVAGRGGKVSGNSSFDILNQAGRVEVDVNGFKQTAGLGLHASMAELLETGALPGSQGITLTDRVVRFGDIYDLGRLDGRTVVFALVTEKVNGTLVKKLPD